MELEKTISDELQCWTRKNAKPLALGLSSTAGLMYLWDAGYKLFASALSTLTLGGAFLYWSIKSREEIRPRDAVVITGCDTGLGYSLALHCQSLGITVIAGVLQPNGLGAQDLARNGILVYSLDVTRGDSVQNFGAAIRTVMRQMNLRIRALVNNAGVMVFGEFEWQTEDQMRNQVEVNLLGTMRVTKELMPLIRANRGRVVVVSSHCSSEPLPGVACYAATKAAVTAWATALRVELVKYGVDVVSFVPGSFARESNLLARQDKHFAAMRSSMSEEARLFYGSYFTRYTDYLSGLSREIAPQKLENPLLYEAFDGALLDRYPSAVYKCEPWRYTYYHLLFKATPTRVRDGLVEKFMQMPKWKNDMEHVDSMDIDSLESSTLTNISEPVDHKLEILRPYKSNSMQAETNSLSTDCDLPEDSSSMRSVKSSPDDILANTNLKLAKRDSDPR